MNTVYSDLFAHILKIIVILSLFSLQGTYSVGSQISCTSCPAGEACPNTNSNETVTCSPGEYSVGRQTVCLFSCFCFLWIAKCKAYMKYQRPLKIHELQAAVF